MQQKKLGKISYLVVSLVAVAVQILLDQWSKSAAFNSLSFSEERTFIGKLITLELCYNEGSSFGMFQGAHVLFFVITLIGLPLFCWLAWRARTRSVWGQIGFNLCIGGTIGNVIDRAFVESEGFYAGKVRDFICYNLPSGDGWRSLFIGNVADIFLVVGVAMAVLAIVFFDEDGLVCDIKKSKTSKKSTVETENEND